MAKHTYHFKHDFNAHNDEKIIDLRMDLGFEGYGVFWYLIEVLAGADGYKLESNYKRLSFTCGITEGTLRSVIEDYKLFVIEEGFFWSASLMKRMRKLDDIKRARAEAGAKGGKSLAKGKQLLSNEEPIAKQNQAEESKGEESKVNESKGEESKGGKTPNPPKDLFEVLDYAYIKCGYYEFDAFDFYEKNEAMNWWRSDGEPILRWKLYLGNWAKKNFNKLSSRRQPKLNEWMNSKGQGSKVPKEAIMALQKQMRANR
tara:strand:+ start:43 stop:816 length:774 start_codon:yes stop_codon:yes gene_type:complete